MNYWKSVIPKLPIKDLLFLAKDLKHRIRSHTSGGHPVQPYVEKQQALLEIVQEELMERIL